MSLTHSRKTNFTQYPFLWLAVCFAVGIAGAEFLSWSPAVFLAAGSISGFLTGVVLRKKVALIFLSLAFISAGGLFLSIEKRGVSADRLKTFYDAGRFKSGDPIEIEGVLQNEPEPAVGGNFLFLRAEKAIYKGREQKVSGTIRYFAPVSGERMEEEYERLELGYGSRVRIAAPVRRQEKYLNPGVASRKNLLDRRGLDAIGTVKSPLLVEKISETGAFSPLAPLFKYRQNLINGLRNRFNPETSGILIASLLGNRHFLDKPTGEIFRQGGTFHVLVISGLHITFIGSLMLVFVRIFTGGKFRQFVLAAASLWAYALVVGANVPVVRASLMFTFLLFSQVLNRRGTLLNAFGGCVIVLLIWRPEDLFDQSFQLTVASVAAIVSTAFPLIEKLRSVGSWMPSAAEPFPPNVSPHVKSFAEMLYWREDAWRRNEKRQIWSARLFKAPYLKKFSVGGRQSFLRFLFEGIWISLVVQAWILPLSVFYFHRLSFFGVVLNLWVGVNIVLSAFFAVFSLALAGLSEMLAAPVIKLTEFLVRFLIVVPQWLIENDLASIRLPIFSGNLRAIYPLYFLPLLILALGLNRWNPFRLNSRSEKSKFSRRRSIRFALAGLVLCGALIVFHPFSAPPADGRLHFDFLDVGQGDAALITFPDGQTMLVDGGGIMSFNREADGEAGIFEPDIPSIGESVVSEFLWEKGYARVDYILATHADADHIRGLADVAGNFRIGRALFGRAPVGNPEFERLSSVLDRRGVDRELISRGDPLNVGGVRVEILYPVADRSAEAVSDNNHSLVLRLVYGNRSFLLTGDIEKETEGILAGNSFLKSDVVKVAHHGSRTSSTPDFVNAVRARYAIVPVGRDSPFGHPHREVIERWKNSGARIFLTGERGTVSVSTDGKDLQIGTFIK
ncbi:MAG: ComEC/Rec2 family competence protein [Pyrinomonadaceae bacterium]